MKAVALLLILSFVAAPLTHAAIAAGELPEMGSLAALISKNAPSTANAPTPDGSHEISAGLLAPDDARGTAAAWLAEGLSGGDVEMEKTLSGAINTERENVEKSLGERGFVMNDLGVVLAMNFVMLWDLATGSALSNEASLKVGQSLVEMFAKESPVASLDDEDKATALDVLITMPVTYTSLVNGYEQNGRTEEAKTLRQQASGEFEKLFKLPAAMITIDESGTIGIDAETAQAWQAKQGIASGW